MALNCIFYRFFLFEVFSEIVVGFFDLLIILFLKSFENFYNFFLTHETLISGFEGKSLLTEIVVWLRGMLGIWIIEDYLWLCTRVRINSILAISFNAHTVPFFEMDNATRNYYFRLRNNLVFSAFDVLDMLIFLAFINPNNFLLIFITLRLFLLD